MRPVEHLHAVGRDYPGVWRQYDVFLTDRKRLGDWPSWCFCPLAGAYAVVGQGRDVPHRLIRDVARVGALASWRPTQGIYRIDPDVLSSLWETPVTGDLPSDYLKRLPAWCVYVEVPTERGAHGFFAHLEHDANVGRSELRIMVDYDTGLYPIILHLTGGTIEESIRAAAREGAIRLGVASAMGLAESAIAAEVTENAEPLVSLLLYLCSPSAELVPLRKPLKPRMKRGKRGQPYMPAAKSPTVWQTAFDLGRRIRESRSEEHQGGSVRGHIRRPHWHSYWVGTGDDRRLDVRWQPPIRVKLDDAPDRPTVHHAKHEPLADRDYVPNLSNPERFLIEKVAQLESIVTAESRSAYERLVAMGLVSEDPTGDSWRYRITVLGRKAARDQPPATGTQLFRTGRWTDHQDE